MKRRDFIKGLMAVPVVVALPALAKEESGYFAVLHSDAGSYVRTAGDKTATECDLYHKAMTRRMADDMERIVHPPMMHSDYSEKEWLKAGETLRKQLRLMSKR